MERRKTRPVRVRSVTIGGAAHVSVQSMTNTRTSDVPATLDQIRRLIGAGCQIVRVSCYDAACAHAIRGIRDNIDIPLVADIHFDYRLAIAAIENGADKIRFNPGNIGSAEHVRSLVACAKAHGTPIRIGVNAGSIEKDLKHQYGAATPDAMVESALRHVRILENEGFFDVVLSLKASSVEDTVEAYRRIAKVVDYPLHIGVTETGSPEQGVIKSAVGVGALLLDGIGDTVRISLTDDPVREVIVAKQILRALHLLNDDVEIISCPTCGRTRVSVQEAVAEVERRVLHNRGYLKVAVMGCAVNGPGEASDADIGIAFGNGNGVIFKKGEKYCSGDMPGILNTMIDEANRMLASESH